MTDFLPKEYEVPTSANGYMKLVKGENRLRIMSSPILGWETWTETSEGGRKPLRHPMDKPFATTEIEDGDPANVKHFWAMIVWNYKEERIQILELTQKGIQKTLRALTKDADWGSPVNTYDIVISRDGEGMETKYEVLPKPVKKTDVRIEKAMAETYINLKALYDGENPFQETKDLAEDAIKAGL